MRDAYSENQSYWANSEPQQMSSARRGKNPLGSTGDEVEADVDTIEPIRLAFGSPMVLQEDSSREQAKHEPSQRTDSAAEEPLAEEFDADATPTASVLDGVETPDQTPEQLSSRDSHLEAHLSQAAPTALQASHSEFCREAFCLQMYLYELCPLPPNI